MTNTIQNGSADDSLEHYGIKGMKWGITRSREKLASLRKTANDPDSADTATKKELRAKVKANRSTDPLSNKELQAVIQRMNLESQYASLNQTRSQKVMSNGKDFAQGIIKENAKAVISKQLKTQISDSLDAKSRKKES